LPRGDTVRHPPGAPVSPARPQVRCRFVQFRRRFKSLPRGAFRLGERPRASKAAAVFTSACGYRAAAAALRHDTLADSSVPSSPPRRCRDCHKLGRIWIGLDGAAVTDLRPPDRPIRCKVLPRLTSAGRESGCNASALPVAQLKRPGIRSWPAEYRPAPVKYRFGRPPSAAARRQDGASGAFPRCFQVWPEG